MPFATMQLANFIMDTDVTQAQVAGAIDTYTAQMQRMEAIIKRPEFTRDQSRDGADLIRKLTETMNAATHEANRCCVSVVIVADTKYDNVKITFEGIDLVSEYCSSVYAGLLNAPPCDRGGHGRRGS